MKTIQEHLRELDREQLIDDYEYRIRDRIVEAYCNVEQSDIADLTLEEIYRRTVKNIGEYVDRLRNLKTAPLDDGKVGVLYLYDRLTDALDYENEPCCEFVHLDEVLEHGDAAENYSYKLCSQEQIMGFFVSDDRYTRNHLYNLAVAVMHEASWFGYADEDKAEVIDSINNPIFDDDSELEFDDDDDEPAVAREGDREFEEVWRRASDMVNRYNIRSNKTQLRLIQKNLRREE